MNRTAIKISLCLFLIPALFSEACGQIRLAVLPFVSRSSEVSSWQASQVTEMIMRGLHSSPSILLTERERLRTVLAEQGFNLLSGAFDQNTAVKIGKIIGCQYILFGSVMQVAEKYLTDSFLLSGRATKETAAVIEARIIDVATRRIVLSMSETGSYMEILQERVQSSNHRKAALEIAASRLCDRVRALLADEYPAIISVRKNKIRINRGKNSGVNAGTLYRVYQEYEIPYEINGRSPGKHTISLAVIRVTDVQGGFSTAEVIKPDTKSKTPGKRKAGKNKRAGRESNTDLPALELIREGDKVEIISSSEAERIILSSKRI